MLSEAMMVTRIHHCYLGFRAIHTDYSNLDPLADAALAVWAVIIYIEFQAAAVSFGSRKKAKCQFLLAILTVTSKKLT